MLSEQKLSNTLRIQIIEQIAEIDLPGFLFLEIDTALSMLNYFKLANLRKNIDAYVTCLQELAHRYFHDMIYKTQHAHIQRFAQTEVAAFMTDMLMQRGVKLRLSHQELTKIDSFYRVTCLLRMKEYINRRIYNDQTHLGTNKLRRGKKA